MPRVKVGLVAIDLDGTLLNSQHRLAKEDRLAVQALSRQGVKVILASGRMYRTILPFSQEIGLRDPIIAYNGGLVTDVGTGETLHHQPVPWSIASELIDWCRQRDLHLNFYFEDELYVRELNQWSELYDGRTGAVSRPVGDLHQLAGHEPTKLQIVVSANKAEQLLSEVRTWAEERVIAMHTMPEYIEIVNRETSKGRALQTLSDQFQIPLEETAAFGDSPNDESMLEVAGFRVVMANASDAIKAHADHITTSSDKAGVARAIRQFLL